MPRQRRGQVTRIKTIGGEVTFSVQDSQFVEWRQPVEHFGRAARDYGPVFEAYSAYHRRSIDRNFAAEGRPDRWAALAPATIADRRRRGFGAGPILQRTGALARSWRFDWGPRHYRVWNARWWWVVHQSGSEKANVPARPMLVLLPQDKAQFTRLARQHLLPGRGT